MSWEQDKRYAQKALKLIKPLASQGTAAASYGDTIAAFRWLGISTEKRVALEGAILVYYSKLVSLRAPSTVGSDIAFNEFTAAEEQLDRAIFQMEAYVEDRIREVEGEDGLY